VWWVATSNVEPDELYKDGLNARCFFPSSPCCASTWMSRGSRAEGFPAGEALGAAGLVRAGRRGARGRAQQFMAEPHRHAVGRALRTSPQRAASSACRKPRAAWRASSFRQLCEQPLGATDYLRIAREFHTLILEETFR